MFNAAAKREDAINKSPICEKKFTQTKSPASVRVKSPIQINQIKKSPLRNDYSLIRDSYKSIQPYLKKESPPKEQIDSSINDAPQVNCSPKSQSATPVTDMTAELTQMDQKSQFESSILEMSPNKVKEIVLSSRLEVFNLIQQKEFQIGENIKHENTISNKIDLGIIEELKRRRLEQRLQNVKDDNEDTLENKRDQVIQDIQKQLTIEAEQAQQLD